FVRLGADYDLDSTTGGTGVDYQRTSRAGTAHPSCTPCPLPPLAVGAESPPTPSGSSAGTLSSYSRTRLRYHPSCCRCRPAHSGPLWPNRSLGLGTTQPSSLRTLARASRTFDARKSPTRQGYTDSGVSAL